MKEFEYTFDEGLRKGLRQFSTGLRNADELVECYNLMPMEAGPDVHEPVVDFNSDLAWGGLGKDLPSIGTRTITIDVTDYISGVDLETVSVYLDGVLKGTTDASGEITIAEVAIGGHTLKLTRTGYVDSDLDTLLNDYVLVT